MCVTQDPRWRLALRTANLIACSFHLPPHDTKNPNLRHSFLSGCSSPAHNYRHHSFLKASQLCHHSAPHLSIFFRFQEPAFRRTSRSHLREGRTTFLRFGGIRFLTLEWYWRSRRTARSWRRSFADQLRALHRQPGCKVTSTAARSAIEARALLATGPPGSEKSQCWPRQRGYPDSKPSA